MIALTLVRGMAGVHYNDRAIAKHTELKMRHFSLIVVHGMSC